MEFNAAELGALSFTFEEIHAIKKSNGDPMMEFKSTELGAFCFTLEEIHAIKKSNGDPVYNANRVLEGGWKKADLVKAGYKGYR